MLAEATAVTKAPWLLSGIVSPVHPAFSVGWPQPFLSVVLTPGPRPGAAATWDIVCFLTEGKEGRR